MEKIFGRYGYVVVGLIIMFVVLFGAPSTYACCCSCGSCGSSCGGQCCWESCCDQNSVEVPGSCSGCGSDQCCNNGSCGSCSGHPEQGRVECSNFSYMSDLDAFSFWGGGGCNQMPYGGVTIATSDNDIRFDCFLGENRCGYAKIFEVPANQLYCYRGRLSCTTDGQWYWSGAWHDAAISGYGMLYNCVTVGCMSPAPPHDIVQSNLVPVPDEIKDGHNHYVHVIRRSGGYTCDSAGCGTINPYNNVLSTPTPTPTPTPIAFPTIAITGNLEFDSGGNCYRASASNPFPNPTIRLIANPAACITPTCTALPNSAQATGYGCHITIDNQFCGTTNNTSRLSLLSTVTGYDNGQWTISISADGNICNSTTNTLDITAGESISRDIVYALSNPQWIKVKDSSVNAAATSVGTVTIPAVVFPYDNSGDDDGQKSFIIGEAGIVSGVTIIAPDPDIAYSTHNWHSASAAISSISPSLFVEYLRSRKNYQSINNLNQIDSDGIYLWTGGDLTIDDPTVISANIVLVNSNHDVTITIDKSVFTPGKTMAIIADNIVFSAATKEATGIFIANHIETGIADQGLKINGNLVALDELVNERSVSDATKPSIFIVAKPNQYLILLPYLSIAKYSWQQLR